MLANCNERGEPMSETKKLHAFAMGYGWIVLALITIILSLLAAGFYSMGRFQLEAWNDGNAKRAAEILLTDQQAAWNAEDLDGFMFGYWKSDDLTFYSDNTIEQGYEPLKQRYFKRYKAEGKEMGKLTFSLVEYVACRSYWRDMVVVRGHWRVEKSKETAEGLFTLWVEKKPEGWRIIHDHTSAAPKKN